MKSITKLKFIIMKKVIVNFLGVMLLTLFMVSCGGSEKETVTSKDVEAMGVYGDDASLISIVPNTYTLNKKDGRLRLKVQLKLEKRTDSDVDIYPVLVLKDEDGVQIVDGWYQMEFSDSEKAKLETFLKGEVGSISDFVFINEFSSDYFKKALSSSASFSIDKLRLEKKKTEQDVLKTEVKAFEDMAEDVINMAEDFDEEDYEDALNVAKQSLDAAEKIIEMEEDLLKLVW